MRRYWTPIIRPESGPASESPRRLLPRAIFMTDDQKTPDPLSVIKVLPRNTGVIFRHYDHPERDRQLVKVRRYCRKSGISFFLALTAPSTVVPVADGYHLPEYLCLALSRVAIARLAKSGLITAAVHSEAGLRKSTFLGVDAALLSPIFQTTSHPERTPIGLHRFARILEWARLPLYALGGADDKKLTGLAGQKYFAGVAGITLFTSTV